MRRRESECESLFAGPGDGLFVARLLLAMEHGANATDASMVLILQTHTRKARAHVVC